MQTENPLGERDEARPVHEAHFQQMVSYYKRTAKAYNGWHCNTSDNSSHNFAVRDILAVMQQTGSKTLLDVCCGTGRAIKAALDKGYQASGVDACGDLLEIGRREFGIPAENLREADATQLPFPDNSFDVVCILGALHHTAMPHQVVSELIRVSRHAIVISDEANHLFGGVKSILLRLGLFEPLYRLVFRRPPRQSRRLVVSESDGPSFVFTIEEIIPMLRERFAHFKCRTFYRAGKFQISSFYFPRLFARQGVITVFQKTP
jgi:ubiquinone/menaquinone biosynthesis C-methylase UbiE